MPNQNLLPAILADEIGLCHLRRGTIVARTVFEPVFAFEGEDLAQAALKARTECYIAGHLVRGPAGESRLASGDPAFDLACALSHIRNFAQVEEAGGSLLVDLAEAPEPVFTAFANQLEEEFAFGWVDPCQIVLVISSRGEAARCASIAARLREIGVRLCLAEFGAAPAASALVESLRPHMVRFEAGWVRRAAGFDPAQRLLGSLVGLLRDRGLSIMLDGVSDDAELDIARQAGMDLFCGPFLAPPYAAGVAQDHRPPASAGSACAAAPAGNVVRLRV